MSVRFDTNTGLLQKGYFYILLDDYVECIDGTIQNRYPV